MKARITCTTVLEYEIDLELYEKGLTFEEALQIDLEQYRDDPDVFFECASVNATYHSTFTGEVFE
jgi:hypothetical protein